MSYRIVEQPSGLLFGARTSRSAHLEALQQLIAAGPGKVLQLEEVRGRAGLRHQAKKHGIKILFAEHEGKLLVRIDGQAGPEGALIEFLREGPKGMVEIAAHLTALGIENHTALLADLTRADRIELKTIAGFKKWQLIKAA